jgi:hypothetical protein
MILPSITTLLLGLAVTVVLAIVAWYVSRRTAVVPTLDETDALWAVKIDDVVPRTARDLAASVESMLRSCSKVVFIDPNFGPENARHRRPLREFLRVLGARPLEEFPEVEIHTKEKSNVEFFKETCETELTGLIPAGFSVRFKRWRIRAESEALHHRYILTDLVELASGVAWTTGQVVRQMT